MGATTKGGVLTVTRNNAVPISNRSCLRERALLEKWSEVTPAGQGRGRRLGHAAPNTKESQQFC